MPGPAIGEGATDLPLQDIVDGVEDELLVIDSNHLIRLINSAASAKLQANAQLLSGKHCYEVLYGSDKPCNTSLWDCPLRHVLSTGKAATIIHPYNLRGNVKYIKITAYPLKDSQGNAIAMLEMRREVTTERELEKQILRRHYQLLALSRVSGAVSSLQNLDTILRTALDNVLEVVQGAVGGILVIDEQTGILSYRVQRGLSARYAEEMQMSVGEGIAGRVAQIGKPILVEDISKDPRTAHPDLVNAEGLKGFISVPLKSKDKVVGVMNIASTNEGRFSTDDISLLSSIGDYLGTAIEQARLYERLKRARERYKLLLQHALTAQEDERKRVARELHDETSQAITSLTLRLQAIIQTAEIQGIGDAQFVESLKSAHTNAVHAGNEVVKLMKELRPTLLDALGLPVAIQRYARDVLQTKGIDVSVDCSGVETRLPPEIEVTLFRIAQGAIGNILEHSGAKQAAIKLDCTDTECHLSIIDDGRGFDVSKITQVNSQGRGAGLFTMKERVKLVSGVCHIDSQPNQGTSVNVTVPLVKDEADETDKGTHS